jgi:hypothetical protein
VGPTSASPTASPSSRAPPPLRRTARHGCRARWSPPGSPTRGPPGGDVAVIVNPAGSKSQQNAQRRGFDLLYTRATLVIAPLGRAFTPTACLRELHTQAPNLAIIARVDRRCRNARAGCRPPGRRASR